MTIAYISHQDCAAHQTGPGHPEAPERLAAIEDRLIASGLGVLLERYDAPLASDAELSTLHDPAYLAWLQARLPDGEGLVELDPTGDTVVGRHALLAARRAAGAALLAVDLALERRHARVFCATRPPGHHAGRARAMGFCLFNNAALAAWRALEQHGLERVAVVDFDVHHGNGTEELLGADPRVLVCSVFQERLYPCEDAVAGVNSAGGAVRVALPALTTGRPFRQAVAAHCLPALRAFRPQLLIVSAGFDGHHEDPVSDVLLREADYAWVTRELVTIAENCAEGRLVSCLEGGYALSALGRCVSAHIDALLGAGA
jgi:acetoin utilization deacetylase AcuC-like enzyme